MLPLGLFRPKPFRTVTSGSGLGGCPKLPASPRQARSTPRYRRPEASSLVLLAGVQQFERRSQIGNRINQAVMLDAAPDADEMYTRAPRGFAIDPAVAHVNSARRIDSGAIKAQAQDVRRRLG